MPSIRALQEVACPLAAFGGLMCPWLHFTNHTTLEISL